MLTLAANGNVAAWQEAVVGSESNGLKLAEVRVNVGDVVKKGQVLAVFSPETVQADIAQSRASLAEARATAADAAGNAARARTLQATGALSQQQINQYQTTEQTAKARVEAAEAVLAAQQVRGRNTQVLAPDDGVISARTATVGSVVGRHRAVPADPPGPPRMARRSHLGRARPHRGRHPAFVVSASGAQVRGKVRSIAPTVDPQTRAALVYVDLPAVQQNTGIKAGMFARGDFELGRSRRPPCRRAPSCRATASTTCSCCKPDNKRGAAEGADRPPPERPHRDHQRAARRRAGGGAGRGLPERRRPGARGGGPRPCLPLRLLPASAPAAAPGPAGGLRRRAK
jgi:hypothetical protein